MEDITTEVAAGNYYEEKVKRPETTEVFSRGHYSETKLDKSLGQMVSEESIWDLLKGLSVCRITKLSCRFGIQIDVLQH